jgi:SPP1 family phage portal protein
MILIYDRQPEPDERFAIRYLRRDDGNYSVEYYTDEVVYNYLRENNNSGKWEYTLLSESPNFYGKVPVTPYYMNDRSIGLIEPVTGIIDDYDIIVSDSMIEFQRFANAYLRVVGMSIGDPTGQNPKLMRAIMSRIKQSRVFDQLKASDDVTFLTKDIPKEFIEYMTGLLKDQIHEQSHVPDFNSEKFSGQLSGAAIERMLFDFENVVSSAQADFDLGLYDRLTHVTKILEAAGIATGNPQDIIINHRRNIPIDELDVAQVAMSMRNTGISMESVVENMPREVIPSVEAELERQKAEQESAYPDLDEIRLINADTETA